RVLHAARPRHLGDVDETFDAFLELDEGAVVLERDHLAADDRAGHVLLGGAAPRVFRDLLETERDALGVRVELEDLHANVVTDLEQLARVIDATPAHVGDVEQTVDTAEIDEGTVLGEVLDDALDDLAFLQALERRLLEGGALLLEEHAARQYDVAALLVELDDLELEVLTEERVEVAHRAQVDLRTGEERLHAAADRDREATLHARGDDAFDQLVPLTRGADLVPDLEPVGLLFREDAHAGVVLARLEQHVDDIAGLYPDRAVRLPELLERDLTLALVADIDDRVVLTNGD